MDNIYILKSDNYYKIGVATDVDRRIKELQIGNPYTIEHVFSKQVPEAYEAERFIHETFEDYKVRGEWFGFDAKILDIVETMIVSHMRLCNIGPEDKERVKNWFLFKSS